MSWTPADWINRGGELLATNPAMAQRWLGRGIQALPAQAVGYYNLAIGLHQQGHIAAAIRAYQICLQLPGAPLQEAHNNLSQDLLLAGRWEEGWALYRQRFQRKPGNYPHFLRLFGPPHWGPLKPDGTMLLMGEQGLGDTLQFCRFALELQAKGIKPILLCQPTLVPLLREGSDLQHVEAALDAEKLQPEQPNWLPLLDLPACLGCNPREIAHSQGYLRADPGRISRWHRLLQRRPGHRLIALHWQGNPSHEKSLYSRGRSMDFHHWLGLAPVEGVEFVSIQKGAGSDQLRLDAGLPFVDGQAAVDASMDFRDTAAVLANCDLLISADSGVVHLAGALGLPTWVALRKVPEWRWGPSGEHTPWYSSLRLFRQPSDGDWASVVAQMRSQLLSTADGARSPDSAVSGG
ncbi:glycosyltransferase family 9 protein [Cyanobium sp. WAJ14-Wanaka]|uniref:glycosyltransferase family 9 protein n=1 Tax=Cyanobium sp. WAJ14-Wanaka TaxID=2823725 RepID=UPI0020CE440C|nr:glycosyltransferase family 9 protein [Cyanobium sp. WAJ14-Wanaka]MCP9775635.1 hypothetical protein [Cyanobium sp. WAJ14-Wanaka]